MLYCLRNQTEVKAWKPCLCVTTILQFWNQLKFILKQRDFCLLYTSPLGFGADDYVTKPFNPLELVARVKSQIRRYVSFSGFVQKAEQIVTGGLILDTEAKTVSVDGEPVRLTAREYMILEYLCKNMGRVLSSAQIYEAVWNEPAFRTEKTVTVHIKNIREKIEINPKDPKYIKVVYGLGYKVDKI